MMPRGPAFSPSEDATLREMAPSHTITEIAYALQRQYRVIIRRAEKLGVTLHRARNDTLRSDHAAELLRTWKRDAADVIAGRKL